MESVITKDVGQNDSAVLALLNPFTLYVINVSAFTSKGEGSHASVEILTDEGREYTLLFILIRLLYLQSWTNCVGKCQKHEITIVISTE